MGQPAPQTIHSHPLDGAVAKFNRCKEVWDELLAEYQAFVQSDPPPYYSEGSFDRESWEWVERFRVRANPPLHLGILLGDCLHNLRSCLDHIVWQVTLLDGAKPNRQTQFPIISKDAT